MDFYNSDYNTTYQDIKDDDYSDVVYKFDLLKVFNMNENDEFDLVTQRVGKIYTYLQNNGVLQNNEFNKILIKSSSKIMSYDKEIGFMMLFSFDTLYLVHRLIKDFINNKQLNNTIIQEINNKI